ncbi:MAG: DUF4153 domain-containing protein, partial [Paracoccaceae bacterium]|nr:DUF4153 domain-containing protein [Paracoccaceae bacterium]
MDPTLRQRAVMVLIGGLAGLSLYVLSEVLRQELLPDRLALALSGFAVVFFGGVLAMTGPIRLTRAASGALGAAVVVAGLLTWASLRYARVADFLEAPMPFLAALVLATVPLPFFIAASGPGWRDYATLFTQSWTIAVRYAAAWLFTAVVWAVIFLSDALLSIVGLTVIEVLIDQEPVPWLVTGAVLGLGLAVVTELSDLVSPYLVLRLLRLLLPVVLTVMALFVLALPLRGISHLFGDLSVAATLLAMAAAALTLVSTAVDQSDDEAVEGRFMALAARGLALLVPVYGALAGWAVWLRVDQYGWTPPRLFAAVMAALVVGYGLAYLWAVLGAVFSGRGWMAGIRQANLAMALVLMAAAAVWLTPLFDPQAISARDQLARYMAGRTAVGNLDLDALANWGRAGQGALARLDDVAKDPGQEALAAILASRSTAGGMDDLGRTGLLAQLKTRMPLRPEAATPARNLVFDSLSVQELAAWAESCATLLPDGRPGCV